MARTKEGALLTQAHRLQQLALRSQTVRDTLQLMGLWDPHQPDTYVSLQAAMTALVHMRSDQSAALAANYYEAFRAAESPALSAALSAGRRAAALSQSVRMAAPVPDAQIETSLAVTTQATLYRGLGSGQSWMQAMDNVKVAASGAMSRLSLEGGRNTIQEEVQRDPKALGWSRVAGDVCCAFCAMLVSRGPVYKEDTVDFPAHDHCTCGSEPYYEGSDWAPGARDLRDLWDKTGSLNSFRDALSQPSDQPSPAATASA